MKRATLVFGTARRMAAILLAAFLTLGTILPGGNSEIFSSLALRASAMSDAPATGFSADLSQKTLKIYSEAGWNEFADYCLGGDEG